MDWYTGNMNFAAEVKRFGVVFSKIYIVAGTMLKLC